MAAKILLVEDDNNLREIYEARLQAEGYAIVTATDGEQALVVAKAETPDLVISDVMMPRISGFEMLDILRNTDSLKDTKVIMLTALGQADDKTRANSLGADRYLVKSQVTLEDIVKAAHELLEGAAPAAPSASGATAASPAPAAPAVDSVVAPAAPASPSTAPSDLSTATPPAAPVAVPPTAAPIAPEPPTPLAPTAAASPAFNPALGAQVTPADPAPTVTPAADEMPTATVSEEKAAVGAQIDSFVNSAALNTAEPSPAQQDDAVLADAMHDLANGAEEQPEGNAAATTSDSPAEPEPAAPEPAMPQTPTETEPAVPTNPSTPLDPPVPPVSISGNESLTSRRVIQPLSAPEQKPGIHELLARENAGEGAPADITPPAPSTTFSPTSTPAPAPAPAPNPGDTDPNNIAL